MGEIELPDAIAANIPYRFLPDRDRRQFTAHVPNEDDLGRLIARRNMRGLRGDYGLNAGGPDSMNQPLV